MQGYTVTVGYCTVLPRGVFSSSRTPFVEASCVFKPVHLNSESAFSFSAHFPSAGPPAHRKRETQLVGETEHDTRGQTGQKEKCRWGRGRARKGCGRSTQEMRNTCSPNRFQWAQKRTGKKGGAAFKISIYTGQNILKGCSQESTRLRSDF